MRSAHVRHHAAAALLTTLVLALTACNGTDSDNAAGNGKPSGSPKASTSASSSASAAPEKSGGGTGSQGKGDAKETPDSRASKGSSSSGGGGTSGGGTSGGGKSGGGTSGGGKSGGGTSGGDGPIATSKVCAPSDLTMFVAREEEPLRHILLGVKNKTGTACLLLGFPDVVFDGLDGTAMRFEDSLPHSPLQLDGGGHAYAGLMSDEGSPDAGPVKEITVFLQGENGSNQSGSLHGTLPPGTKVYDPYVTAWQETEADAAYTN